VTVKAKKKHRSRFDDEERSISAYLKLEARLNKTAKVTHENIILLVYEMGGCINKA
jgi:hypothetical protein